MRKIVVTAIISSALTVALMRLSGAGQSYTEKVVLDNARVTVTERVMDPGASRESHVRSTDQVIVFLNEAAYDRVDGKTKQTQRQGRKAGEVLWHFKGETAPQLINRSATPMRSLIIALK